MTRPVAAAAVDLPETAELESVLDRLLGLEPGAAEVLDRRANAAASTFPSEVVELRLPDGSVLAVHCKYSGGREQARFGHRGGVAYEAQVYEHVLAPAGTTTPGLVGTCARGEDETWLFLEYLEGVERASRSPDGDAMARAGAWIGALQQGLEAFAASSPAADVLTRYDRAYYRGWIERTFEYVDPGRRPGWLGELAAQADAIAGVIAGLPPTVIHGEYTPANVLYREGVVYVVDWESAAVGAGEIDLAFFVDGWEPGTAAAVERAYYEARFPAGAPGPSGDALALARLYVHTRWLGDRPSWTRHRKMYARLDRLEGVARGLGLA